MTPNEAVSFLAERSGRTFDIPFQQELKVLFRITAVRYVKNSLEKKPLDRRFFLQSFVAPLKKVSAIECPIEWGCALRTVDKIPRPVRSNNVLFDFVGSADFVVSYGHGGDWKENYFKTNRYTGTKTRYMFRDQYLYISSEDNGVEYIGIQGVFEDPTLVNTFKCNEYGCVGDDEDYPIPADLFEPILRDIMQTKFGNVPKNDGEIKVDEARN